MEDLLLYCAATLALRYVRLGIFGRPERRLQQQVAHAKHTLSLDLARFLSLR